MTATSTRLITAEELFEMGDIGRCELVRGEIVHMVPPGFDHGDVTYELGFRIGSRVRNYKLGKMMAAETGFVLARNPDTVRAPDVAIVQKRRLPRGRHPKYFEGAPDLAIGVLSPSDRMSEVNTKTNEWLAAGAQSVWIVDPPNRTITVHRPGGQIIQYAATDAIADEPALPGFTLKLDELFGTQ